MTAPISADEARRQSLELSKAILRGECSTFGDEVPLAKSVVSYAVEVDRLAATVERLSEENERLRGGLLHYWESETCPCGARIEDPAGFPHVSGCPVAAALSDEKGDDRG